MVRRLDESCLLALAAGLALIVYALYLGEGDDLTVAASIGISVIALEWRITSLCGQPAVNFAASKNSGAALSPASP